MGTPKIVPPTPRARQFVNYVLGFGVGVAVGLSVYLGKLDLPLFAPLLDLIPASLQNALIPLSSALMGILAVAVQFYGYRQWSNKELALYFRRLFAAAVAAVILLLVVHTFTTVTIETTPGSSVSFVVGFTRPQRAPCPAEISDADCIGRLSFELSRISSFWGDRRIKMAGLALELSYLAATGVFGALVGLIVLARRR
jgi:hypothetical protein